MADTHKSILSAIGSFFKKFFDKALPVAVAIEPIIDTAFPGIAALYNATVSMALQAEMTAAAVGVQDGSGPQKLALVVAGLKPLMLDYLQKQGITADDTVVTNWVNAVVASLNALPAPLPKS